MTEQFTFHESIRHRGAIDLDESAALAGAVGVDRSCHEFLPRPRLTVDRRKCPESATWETMLRTSSIGLEFPMMSVEMARV